MTEILSPQELQLASRRDEARALADSGRVLEAEQAFLAILREAPQDIDALNFIAICAYERGQFAQARTLLERARGARADDPNTLTNLGVANQMLGRLDEAADALRAALRAAPDFFIAKLRLGNVLEQMGRRDEAVPVLYGAILAAQGRGYWLNDATTAPGLRPIVLQAMSTVAIGRLAYFSTVMTPLRERYGAAELVRVEKALAIQLMEMPANYVDPKQRPKFLYFPDLPTVKYFDRALFPWYAELEAKTATIRDEMLAVLAEDGGFEPFLGHFDRPDQLEQYLRGDRGTPAWNAFFFYRHGETVAQNHERCPHTSAALDRAPLCRIREHAPEVCYSVLTPGSHILPHHGVTNVRAVTHLPLIVPEDCALVVGGEARSWEEARCFTFDDTFEHEAWNRSERTRVVMLMDVWNPYLSEAERAAMTDIIEAIGDFNRAAEAS